MRDGIRLLLIDPWNEIEHARGRNESTTEYIARGIRALKRFARLYSVAVIVVAHPTKDIVQKDGSTRAVSLYDIDGSAAWFNKADHGLVIARDAMRDESTVTVAKVRFEETGEKGAVRLRYDRFSSRFEMLEGGHDATAEAR